jgi:hypothetical protein
VGPHVVPGRERFSTNPPEAFVTALAFVRVQVSVVPYFEV